MPLTPATTDKFMKVGTPGTATTLSAPGFTNGVTTALVVGSTANWPTDTLVPFAVDRAQVVNGVEQRIAGTYNEFTGIVSSATGVSSIVRTYGTPQDYPAGSLTRVYIPVTGTQVNNTVDGLNQDHNGKGNHKTLTDDNGNEWLERGQVASAVNQVKVTNAITGKKPIISASGDDANAGVSVQGKGTGLADMDGAVPKAFFALFDFIESGCVWTADAAGSTLLASMSSGFVWIGGKRLSVAAQANHAFPASKDCYIDFTDNGDGTAVVNYVTAVANNAASPALTTSGLRNAIIVTGATNIAAAASINQGQEDRVLPIASSIPYAVTDSNGVLICPRDPQRKVLGYRQILAPFATANVSPTQIPGLSVPVIVPTGRKVKVCAYAADANNSTIAYADTTIWDGTVGSGTQLEMSRNWSSTAVRGQQVSMQTINTPATATKIYNLAFHAEGGGTATMIATALGGGYGPAAIWVELV